MRKISTPEKRQFQSQTVYITLLSLFFIGLESTLAPSFGQNFLPPPPVGTFQVRRMSMIESQEFPGRIQAIEKVILNARVTGYLEKVFFKDGAEVKRDDLLYKIERGIYEADVAAKNSTIAQIQAQLDNAIIEERRAGELMRSSAGSRSTYDLARSNKLSFIAQLEAARAQLRQSELNLSYTEIRAPIDGKISKTYVTMGNLITPNSATLAILVSQDPMYVYFSVPVRTALLLIKTEGKGNAFNELDLKIRLPDAEMYGEIGKIDFVDNQIAADTDTITLRGTIANPPLASSIPSNPQALQTHSTARTLIDGEFVSVILSAIKPTEVLAIPRVAIIKDQRGTYVYVLSQDNKAQQRYITLGPSDTSTLVSVIKGLSENEVVIVEGLQRVRPGGLVKPTPLAPSVKELE